MSEKLEKANPPHEKSAAPPPPLERAPLAYENADFLNSPDGRLLRITSEFLEPLARFRREQIQDTVVFFGSARFHSHEEAARELAQTEGGEFSERQRKMAASAVKMARYYEDARSLAKMLTGWAKAIPSKRRRFVVASGGGPGIMEAANRGAYEAGGKTIGLNIYLPFEQKPNAYITPELNFEFHYFFMRKLWFAYLAKALVVFPGGFGTLDEMFEILTLTQTNKLGKKITVIVYGSEYWKSVFNFDALIEAGTISPADLDLFHFVDTPEEAFEKLRQGLTENHLIPEAARMQEAKPAAELHPSLTFEDFVELEASRNH
jgi:uncharacterized protein (TIGR00730 family)